MQNEAKYPRWVNEILRRISVTIYRGKGDQILKEKAPILSLPLKPLSPGGSIFEQRAFVIGFEDEEEIWNQPSDCSDIIVKVYDLREPGKYRVEIFCSGVNKKIIYFEDKEILSYEGYCEADIKDKKQIRGTVIFDVTLPE